MNPTRSAASAARRSAAAALLAALGALSACAHGQATDRTAATPAAAVPAPAALPPAPTPARDDLADLDSAVDAALTAQGEALWRTWTGGEPLDAAAAWSTREWALSPETQSRLDAALVAASPEERPSILRLRGFLAGERLARATAGPARTLAAARATAAVTWEKRSVPLRQVPALLAAEKEAPRRKALADARAGALARLKPLVQAHAAAVNGAAAGLGLGGPLALAGALRGEGSEALAALAEATLARTDATWRALLDALARKELQSPSDRLRERDLPRLLRTTAPAATFPAPRLLPTAESTLAGLGLDLAAGGHLTVDAVARPGKLPRPLAVPVQVPGGVRLSLAPVAGLDAVRALLHELGTAQAAAHAAASTASDRRLVAPAVIEAWGLLLEEVAATPGWLETQGLTPEAARREARVAAARRLHAAREAAARVLVEIARVRDPAGLPALWAALGPRALGHPIDRGEAPPGAHLPDPLLEAAETLRAHLLTAQVELHLQSLGDPWWRSARAGAWLRAAWAEGARRSPAEVARAAGAGGLDPAALDAVVLAGARAGGLDLAGPPVQAPAAPPAPTAP